MKQKDIAMIIIIAAVSGVASFFISGHLFVTPANRQQQVEHVDAIDAEFSVPTTTDFKKYFNSNSIDPTQAVQVHNQDNPNPFSGGQ